MCPSGCDFKVIRSPENASQMPSEVEFVTTNIILFVAFGSKPTSPLEIRIQTQSAQSALKKNIGIAWLCALCGHVQCMLSMHKSSQ